LLHCTVCGTVGKYSPARRPSAEAMRLSLGDVGSPAAVWSNEPCGW
jgi:hypothetical protein